MKRIIILMMVLFLLNVSYIYAKEGRDGRNGNENRVEIRRDDNRVRIEIRERREVENEDELEIEQRERVEIRGNTFEITGKITEILSDSFTLAGQKIFINPNLVGEFEQKGVLKVGETAKVEGIIINNQKFAREIKVFRNQEEVRIEIKENPEEQRLRIRARGTLDQIRDLLNQILSFLRIRS